LLAGPRERARVAPPSPAAAAVAAPRPAAAAPVLSPRGSRAHATRARALR
jgi:hypothetical protein